MKDKIILFVIGLLVGAVIATGAFYVYTTTTNSCNSSNQNTKVISGQPPEMPSGGQGERREPPEKPNGENSQSSEKPSDNGTQNNNTQETN